MKIACQTILWGSKIQCIEEVLSTIAAAGCKGVEISQRLNAEAGIPPSEELKVLLNKYGLELLGLGGGSLLERVNYAKNVFRDIYLYVENQDIKEWRLIADASIHGLIPAVHPHVFRRPLNFDEAFGLLQTHPELMCVPDTAHSAIARDNFFDFVQKFARIDRIPAVHLKDWVPLYGRSSHNYARGFIELGEGEAKVGEFVQFLLKIKYAGWFVVEQDNSKFEPAESLRKSLEYLKKLGVHIDTEAKVAKSFNIPAIIPDASAIKDTDKAKFYTNLIKASSKNQENFFLGVAEEFYRISNCQHVTIWSPIIGKDWMSLLAIYPPPPQGTNYLTKTRVGESVSRETLETKQVTPYDLTLQEKKHISNNREFLKQRGITNVLSIPVLNAFNPNHVLYIINLLDNKPTPLADFDQYSHFASHVAILADRVLNEICAETAGHIDMFSPQPKTVREFVVALDAYIQKKFNCECVSTYLLNNIQGKMESVSPHVKMSEEGPHLFRVDEGVIGKVWKWRRFFITPSLAGESGLEYNFKTLELVASDDRDECLIGPIGVSLPSVLGVVKCINKHKSGNRVMSTLFTDDDAAILEAILQAAAPRLEVLMRHERYMNTLQYIADGIKDPLNTIQGIYSAPKQNYREEINGAVSQQLKMAVDYVAGFVNYGKLLIDVQADKLVPDIREYDLYNEIVKPAIQSVQFLLKKKSIGGEIYIGKEPSRNTDGGPTIMADMAMLTQVFFVLFRNAIIHREPDKLVYIYVETPRRMDNYFSIKVSNRGKDIPRELEENIFNGSGLRLCKKVAIAHNFGLVLWRNQANGPENPTTFELQIPFNLMQFKQKPI
jgi:sugar phosphate isomerase/epimerase